MGILKPLIRRRDVKNVLSFLDEADDAYMNCYLACNIKYLVPFASSDLCQKILDHIKSNPERLFGTRKSRVRQWTILSKKEDLITVKKEIMQRHIEVKKGIKISIGDDFTEVWKVSKQGKNYCIMDIERKGHVYD